MLSYDHRLAEESSACQFDGSRRAGNLSNDRRKQNRSSRQMLYGSIWKTLPVGVAQRRRHTSALRVGPNFAKSPGCHGTQHSVREPALKYLLHVPASE